MSFFSGMPGRQAARVTFDEQQVSLTRADGGVETIRWDDLEGVEIVTTDEGPWRDDVVWLLLGSDGRSRAIPGASEGMQELLPRLQALPGFHHGAVIEAMCSAENARFVAWKRARA